MKWLMVITWLVGNGTPATIVQFESETLCREARDRVMRPQPDTNPIVAERRQIAYAVCFEIAK